MGNYNADNFQLNPQCDSRFRTSNLAVAREFTMKAVHLEDVPYEARVFMPSEGGWSPGQAGVPFAPVGEGHLGWIGDVNTEPECKIMYIAMCNLHDG